MAPCALCNPSNPRRAILRRPKTAQAVCRECFYLAFETEVHHTIMRNSLFKRNEKVGVAASGGKGALSLGIVGDAANPALVVVVFHENRQEADPDTLRDPLTLLPLGLAAQTRQSWRTS